MAGLARHEGFPSETARGFQCLYGRNLPLRILGAVVRYSAVISALRYGAAALLADEAVAVGTRWNKIPSVDPAVTESKCGTMRVVMEFTLSQPQLLGNSP